MRKRWIEITSTFFYVGYFPFAAGSLASVFGALIYVILQAHLALYICFFILITGLGFYVSGPMERIQGEKDPSCVVIDEVAGVMLAFFMLPLQWPVLVTGFFLFRAFDMFKIYPANLWEKKKGGVGIMMDDILAGLYTHVVMHIAIRWAEII